MKVLHISKYYHPFRGGIEKMIKELAEGTVRAGHEVTVLCSNDKPHYQEDMVDGVRVVRLPRWTLAFSQPFSPAFFWRVKKWMNWADVVQVHMPNPMAELGYLLQSTDKPMIANYHCDVVRQKKLAKIYKPVAEKILEKADRIVVSTPYHLKFSKPLQGLSPKAEVIPFGLRPKHAHKTIEINNKVKEIKDKYGDYFLFIGRLVPYKGVDILLRAMAQVDSKLLMIGVGPRWEAWNQLAHDAGVSDRVEFLGLVDDDTEFAAYLHGCQSLVLPSINESEAFGIVLIEAMSCGKPVITTDLKSGVPWVNEAGVTGLQVPPKDVQSLADSLNKMATNHSMREQMGAAALKRFEKLFKIEKMVDSYVSLYGEFLEAQKVAA